MGESNSAEELLDLIKANAADYGPLAFRALIGTVPVFGSVFAAIVEALPGQRLDRIADCLGHLNRRLSQSEVELEQLKALLVAGTAPERAQLLRVGLTYAADAISTERRHRIGDVIAVGLLKGEQKARESTRMLRSISELDDVELSVLGEAVRFGTLGMAVKEISLPEHDVRATESDEHPGLPAALQSWSTPQLYLVLTRLAGAGMLDAGSTIVIDDVPRKFFNVSPMGQLLYDEFVFGSVLREGTVP